MLYLGTNGDDSDLVVQKELDLKSDKTHTHDSRTPGNYLPTDVSAEYVSSRSPVRLAGANPGLGEPVYQAFPSACRTKKGRIIAAWRSAPIHTYDPTGSVVMRYSDNEGATWSTVATIYDNTGADDGPVALISLKDGSVGLLTMSRVGSNTGAMVGRYWISTDEGITWTQRSIPTWSSTDWNFPSDIAAIPQDNGPDVLLATGYGMDVGDTYHYATISRSTDGGYTWTQLPKIKKDPNRHFHEPRLLVLPDNTVVCIMRSDVTADQAHYITYSYDMGDTWTAVRRILGPGVTASNEKTTAQPGLWLSPEGQILMTYREVSTWDYRFAVSRDLGKTWEEKGNPTTAGRSTYGVWAPLADGDVMLIFAKEEGAAYEQSDVHLMRFYRFSGKTRRIALTMASPYVAFGAPYAPPSIAVAGDGRIFLEGFVNRTAASASVKQWLIGTIPAGYRPSYNMNFLVYAKVNAEDPMAYRLVVDAATGDLTLYSLLAKIWPTGTGGWLSLDGPSWYIN